MIGDLGGIPDPVLFPTLELFGSDVARDAVHQKVKLLYPAHEIDEFTELFWSRIQQWRDNENDTSAFKGASA